MDDTGGYANLHAWPRLVAVSASRTNLSDLHLSTADMFATAAEHIEIEESECEWPPPSWDASLSYASASIIHSVSGLEASINEFFHAQSTGRSNLAFIATHQRQLLATLWPTICRSPVLDKLQVALSACGRPSFDTGREPFQSAADLVALRNALVHFTPEWSDEPGAHAKLEERLRSRFSENRLAADVPGQMSWMPGRCLGAGSARWAHDTARDFLDTWCQALAGNALPGDSAS